jgi:acyl-CoA reductase-like NAD-dependent aldehyde dehydrogenase
MPGDALRRLAEATLGAGRLDELPDRHFIDGAWQASRSGRTMPTYDPGSARAYAEFAAGNADDVNDAVAAAEASFGTWRSTAPAERARILHWAADLIRAKADRLTVAETLDCGKPLSEAASDVRSAARTFEYYAGAADTLQGDSIPLGPDYVAYTVFEPVGVTAHIVPWNYPLSTAARSIAPALAAGCTAVVKPAEQTPITALMLAAILNEAGLPDGVCNVVTGIGAEAGAPLAAHKHVRHVTFTGSVATGSAVMKGAAQNIASMTLELGGKSPVVVLADADMDAALEGVAGAIFENAGQICSAGSRLVIERAIRDEFLERLVALTRTFSIGHGLRDAKLGPVSSLQHLEKIAGFVDAARQRGLEIITGGNHTVDPETGTGWFFEPTIIGVDDADDTIVQEEIFGPVLAVQTVDDFEAAINAANGTRYGLVGGIYTRDFSRALRFARDLDAGQVYLNEYFAGGVQVPFGGNKLSGFGREKGLDALRAYRRTKSVVGRI